MQLFKDIIDIKIKNRREDAGLKTDNHLLFVEHDHVYTLGKSGDLENLLANESLLKNIGATFYKINCGGDITYSWSSTNSMLSYTRPRFFFTDIHKYLRFLEEIFIKILADYGLKEKRSDRETGVIDALIILNKNN